MHASDFVGAPRIWPPSRASLLVPAAAEQVFPWTWKLDHVDNSQIILVFNLNVILF
jgi:hypothetical protein